MVNTKMSIEAHRDMLENVFAPDLRGFIKAENAPERPKRLEDLRITKHLEIAYRNGLGVSIPGVRGTAWHSYNSLTEVLSSTHAENGIVRFDRALFGINKARIERGLEYIKDFIGV
jgi:hypothetical protein